jgi:hypothetical protein
MSNINTFCNIDDQLIRSGYDSPLYYTLQEELPDGTMGNLNLSTATIRAALIELDGISVAISAKTLSPTADGADWANGVINIDYTALDTAAIVSRGHYFLELMIEMGGKRIPWPLIKVYAELGHIV